jgi:hypothetical protein
MRTALRVPPVVRSRAGLIGNAAEKAAAAVALIDELKIAVNAYGADRC